MFELISAIVRYFASGFR